MVLRPPANYVIILKSQYNQLTHTVINPVRWERSDDHYLKTLFSTSNSCKHCDYFKLVIIFVFLYIYYLLSVLPFCKEYLQSEASLSVPPAPVQV